MLTVNRITITIISLFLLSITMCYADIGADAKIQLNASQQHVVDQASYILGYAIATSITSQLSDQNITIDKQIFQQAFSDGIKYKTPKLTDAEMNAGIQSIYNSGNAKTNDSNAS